MRDLLRNILPVAVLAIVLFLLFVALTRAQGLARVEDGRPFTCETETVADGPDAAHPSPLFSPGAVLTRHAACEA